MLPLRSFEMEQMLFEHVEQAFFGKRFGEDIGHAARHVVDQLARARVAGHADDGRVRIKLSDQRGGRYTVEVGHDDIHEDQVVLFLIHLVDRSHAIDGIVNGTAKDLQKFGRETPTHLVVIDEQYARRCSPAGYQRGSTPTPGFVAVIC